MTQTPYGLSTPEAEASRAQYGDNSLTEHQHEGFWDKYWANLNDPMIRILCVALVVSIIITIIEHNPWYEPLGIAIAVALATFVSTFSEFRNESAFKRLQDEASRVFSKVYRDGSITELPIDSLVVGDWVLLQAGDLVPSDGVLVEGTVALDQSALNGETEEAEKAVMPQDYIDEGGSLSFLDPYKLFRGSIVVSGQAVLSVTTVGDKSVYGQIAEELQADDDRDTPLKLKLKGLARGISRFGYVGGILIAVAFLFQEIVVAQGFDAAAIAAFASDWLGLLGAATNALMLAVIIIVMAVPEGLPLMIAIVSAQNMGKMLKDNVLVRKLEGIETAGSLNILFSDKTGTITKGQLQAMAFVDGAGRQYQSIDAIAEGLQRLLALSIHKNTDAVIAQEGRGNTRIIGGNATERAILGFAAEAAGSTEATVTGSIPFNSANKYSAAEVNGLPAAPGQSDKLTLVKGAPEKIIERCQYYYESHGQKAALCDPSAVLAQIDALAARAIRVIALATCADGIVQGQLPASAFTLVGIIGIRDEVRPESIGSIAEVQNAGVQVVMITGDRKDTAIAVAREAGLVKDGSDLVLTSDELAQMSDSELKSVLPQVRVIARALPSDKSRLIRLAQDLNLVTGMTGDGVNDSPALKAADVGFAMGGGTEIAKEASEVIIMDDNFSSIDKAILYGRTIFNSIRKFIVFQLTINVAAVLICFIMPLIGHKEPLTITQILWINLVMDTLAALAFGGEPALQRFMSEKPKKRDESIVSRYMWSSILTSGLLVFALSLVFLLAPFVRGLFRDGPGGPTDPSYLLTGYFAFFIFAAILNAFNARTERLNLFDHIQGNRGFVYILLLIAVVQVALLYLGGEIFNGYGLIGREWLVVFGFAILVVPVDLARKAILRALDRKQ